MVLRVRRFFDVRPGEGCRVLLSFLYVGRGRRLVPARQAHPQRPVPATVRSLRPGLRLRGRSRSSCRCSCPSTRVLPARFGLADVTVGTLRVLQRQRPAVLVRLPRSRRGGPTRLGGLVPAGVFYVWVNCFGVDCAGPGVDASPTRCSTPGRRSACSGSSARARRLAPIVRRTSGARPGPAGRRHRQPAAGPRRVDPRRRWHRRVCRGALAHERHRLAPDPAEACLLEQHPADRPVSVSAPSCSPRLPGRDLDPVDGVPAESGRQRTIRPARRRAHRVFRHLLLHHGDGDVRPSAAAERDRCCVGSGSR